MTLKFNNILLAFSIITFTIFSGCTQEEDKIQILEEILKDYHEKHTYSKEDFFVCSDMAIDVWNILETKGINAEIAIGNVDVPIDSIDQINHAWVMAEVAPNQWLALEVTGGYIVYYEDNPNYYRGYFFDTPREFKKYLELVRKYNEKVEKIVMLQNQYEKLYNEYIYEYNKLEKLIERFEKICCEESVSYGMVSICIDLYAEIAEQKSKVSELEGKCEQMVQIIESEEQELENIKTQLIELLRRSI